MYRHKIYTSLVVWGICALLSGCTTKEDPAVVVQVDPVLQPYLDLFLAECKQRGITLTVDNLILKFDQASGDMACGTCQQTVGDPTVQKIIHIDTLASCWQKVSAQAREALVFHELGHCLLNRMQHTDRLLPNGDFASILNGQGDLKLYQICDYDLEGNNSPDCNQTYRRSYYLDELFNANTPVPDWGK